MLMKTYAANYNRLLKQFMEEHSSDFQLFFVAATDVTMLCLPFKIYARKLVNNFSKIIMLYSKIDPTSQILICTALKQMISATHKDDPTFFQNCIKKMYMEFTKESKAGGGGHGVQETLRVAQNCFSELLAIDLTESYQLGFLYIRQLCLHLRNTRNNMNADAVKAIYSW